MQRRCHREFLRVRRNVPMWRKARPRRLVLSRDFIRSRFLFATAGNNYMARFKISGEKKHSHAPVICRPLGINPFTQLSYFAKTYVATTGGSVDLVNTAGWRIKFHDFPPRQAVSPIGDRNHALRPNAVPTRGHL